MGDIESDAQVEPTDAPNVPPPSQAGSGTDSCQSQYMEPLKASREVGGRTRVFRASTMQHSGERNGLVSGGDRSGHGRSTSRVGYVLWMKCISHQQHSRDRFSSTVLQPGILVATVEGQGCPLPPDSDHGLSFVDQMLVAIPEHAVGDNL